MCSAFSDRIPVIKYFDVRTYNNIWRQKEIVLVIFYLTYNNIIHVIIEHLQPPCTGWPFAAFFRFSRRRRCAVKREKFGCPPCTDIIFCIIYTGHTIYNKICVRNTRPRVGARYTMRTWSAAGLVPGSFYGRTLFYYFRYIRNVCQYSLGIYLYNLILYHCMRLIIFCVRDCYFSCAQTKKQ